MPALVTGAMASPGPGSASTWRSKGVADPGHVLRPDGAPRFSHPNLELVPGDLLDRESLKRALDGIEVVRTSPLSIGRPTCPRRPIGTSTSMASATSSRRWPGRGQAFRAVLDGRRAWRDREAAGRRECADQARRLLPGDQVRGRDDVARALPRARHALLGGPAGRDLRAPRAALPQARQALKSGTFVMFGSGEVRYHFIHVEDLCDAMCLCANATRRSARFSSSPTITRSA